MIYGITELEKTGLVKAFYTDKENLCRKKEPGDVAMLAARFGVAPSRIALSCQKHTDNIGIITEDSCGYGIIKEHPYGLYVDGMLTDVPGILLCTYEADCTPVYLLDPVRKVIGMVHGGWKGTAKCIAEKAVGMMSERYGSDPGDILVHLGPCICGECYEVGEELIGEFSEKFSGEQVKSFFAPKDNGKYLLDMKKAIGISLRRAGVVKCNITDSGICTFSSERLCSYRRDGEKYHRMATAIMLKNDGRF